MNNGTSSHVTLDNFNKYLIYIIYIHIYEKYKFIHRIFLEQGLKKKTVSLKPLRSFFICATAVITLLSY